METRDVGQCEQGPAWPSPAASWHLLPTSCLDSLLFARHWASSYLTFPAACEELVLIIPILLM